jgi:hypothetical protein
LTTDGWYRLRIAIASATIQPMNVHPRNRLTTTTDPTLGTPRTAAMIEGRKYAAVTRVIPTTRTTPIRPLLVLVGQ